MGSDFVFKHLPPSLDVQLDICIQLFYLLPLYCILRLLDSHYTKLQSHSHVLYDLCSPSNAVFLGINSLASYIFSY